MARIDIDPIAMCIVCGQVVPSKSPHACPGPAKTPVEKKLDEVLDELKKINRNLEALLAKEAQ